MQREETTMHKEAALSSLSEGGKGSIKSISADGPMRDRLRSLGLIEGCTVECLHKGPSGGIAAYLICGAVIAIRREDADKIIAEICDESQISP